MDQRPRGSTGGARGREPTARLSVTSGKSLPFSEPRSISPLVKWVGGGASPPFAASQAPGCTTHCSARGESISCLSVSGRTWKVLDLSDLQHRAALPDLQMENPGDRRRGPPGPPALASLSPRAGCGEEGAALHNLQPQPPGVSHPAVGSRNTVGRHTRLCEDSMEKPVSEMGA